MDVILVILGTIGLGAILVSSYVFVVAARNYVSDDQTLFAHNTKANTQHSRVERTAKDRRSGRQVTFPLTVNGTLISNDRRSLPDRRMTLA